MEYAFNFDISKVKYGSHYVYETGDGEKEELF